MRPCFALIPAALALAAIPATAQKQASKPELHIDVATHAMPGMPGMGALGRLAGAMGGASARASYGMARHPGMPGRYLDVALHNRSEPGLPARQQVPKGLRVGDHIDLLPRERSGGGDNDGGASPATANAAGDGTFQVRYYWGCGDKAGAGQPLRYTVTFRGGKVVQNGKAPPPRNVAGFEAAARDVLWQNPSSRKAVSGNASLAGTHTLTGGGLAGPMEFELTAEHDFMPALELESVKGQGDGMLLRWNRIEGARAYFIHATAMDGDTMVMWSSSADAYAGPELNGFLGSREIAQWTGKRTLLPADAGECRIPPGVFTGSAAPMVQMAAHGGSHAITTTAGTVHVRNKSTAMLMPGVAGSVGEAAKPSAKDAAKGVLKGLFGR